MTPYVLMVLLAMPGPLLWIINTESILVLQVQQGQLPVPLAACAALGQVLLFLVLYRVGEPTLRRIPFVARRLDAWTNEKRTRMRARTTPALVLGGLTGLPPVVVLACLCGSVVYPRLKMSVLVFLTRFLRFSVVAVGGQQVLAWLGF